MHANLYITPLSFINAGTDFKADVQAAWEWMWLWLSQVKCVSLASLVSWCLCMQICFRMHEKPLQSNKRGIDESIMGLKMYVCMYVFMAENASFGELAQLVPGCSHT
jgi:hypothetical protein